MKTRTLPDAVLRPLFKVGDFISKWWISQSTVFKIHLALMPNIITSAASPVKNGGELSRSIPIPIPLFLLKLQLAKKRKKKKETSGFETWLFAGGIYLLTV